MAIRILRAHILIDHIVLFDNDPARNNEWPCEAELNVMKNERKVSGEGSRPPSVSGSIQLSALPAGPERSSRLFGLAPVGSRRFTMSPTNVTAGRIILDRGCVVSAPLPWLSPGPLRDPPSHGGGTFLSRACALPSAALPLLTFVPRARSYNNIAHGTHNHGRSLRLKAMCYPLLFLIEMRGSCA